MNSFHCFIFDGKVPNGRHRVMMVLTVFVIFSVLTFLYDLCLKNYEVCGV
jgi:hypothetical protein